MKPVRFGMLFLLPAFLLAGIPNQKHLSSKEFQLHRAEDFGKGANLHGRADRKLGIHDGNQIRVKFFNFGPVGGPDRVNPWPRLEWPAHSGHEYLYEMGPLFGARVWGYDRAIQESTWISIVDDPIQDGGDEDFEPLPGYANPDQDTLAFSDKPNTWPEVWGDYYTIYDSLVTGLQGEWPGQFGPGVTVADQESFYIMTDEANIEFNQPTSRFFYDPGGGLNGLGIMVTVRGYQWAALPAEDIIVWVYEVRNISEKDIDSMVVGYFGDFRIGGPGQDFSDDMFGFDSLNNMVFNWDYDNQGIGPGGEPYEPGYLGFKFLESPGNPYDLVDNDGDGLVDESQYNGIDDDQDWQATDEEAAADPRDLDGLSDDTGADGIPGTNDYGEGNGVPDLGEPDYEVLDLDEKDLLGLTAVRSFVYGTAYAAQDSTMLDMMRPGQFGINPGPGDIVSIFSSGFFPLPKGKAARFSIAVILGVDSTDLYQNAFIAQQIYNLNYRFARPPLQPNVRAVVENGKVILYWDDIAERSVDPFLVTIDPALAHDFEGYKIYRSEDRGVTWGDPITDANGRVVYWEPLAVYDLVDGIRGLFPLSTNGAHFYLGSDAGLQHMFVDSGLVMGKHYWYAVTSYDKGNDSLGILPLESPKVLGAPNVVEVVPTTRPAGYVPPEVEIDSSKVVGTGHFEVYTDPSELVDGAEYLVTFSTTDEETLFNMFRKDGETWIPLSLNIPYIHGEDGMPFTEGLRFVIQTDPLEVDSVYQVRGISSFTFSVEPGGTNWTPLAADLEIRFASEVIDTVYYRTTRASDRVGVNFQVWNVTDNQPVSVLFIDQGRDTILNQNGEQLILFLAQDSLGNLDPSSVSWKLTLSSILGMPNDPPGPGDIYYVHISKPFTERDTFQIRVHAPKIDSMAAQNALANVAVVPNPYIVAAQWELRDPNIRYGRGPRELHFINLPPKCTIRIYTITGELVAVIEHDKDPSDPEASLARWNMLTKDGQEIAYGLYIYHVEAPGIGETIGKFAVIK